MIQSPQSIGSNGLPLNTLDNYVKPLGFAPSVYCNCLEDQNPQVS